MKTLLLCAATLLLAPSLHAQTSPQEEILQLEGVNHMREASPDLRVVGHRVFRRSSGNGFIVSYIFTGAMFGGGPGSPVVALDASGQRLWTKGYPFAMRTSNERANAVVELRNSDIAVATRGNLAVERLNSSGASVWQEEVYASLMSHEGGFLFNADEIIETSQGSLAVVGSKVAWNPSDTNVAQDLALARISSDGALVWQTLAGGSGLEVGRAVAELPNQSLIFGGISYSPVSGDKTSPNYGEADIWVAKYSGDGERIWDASFGGSAMEDLLAIRTNRLGIVLFGTSTSPISGNKTTPNLGQKDVWIVQLDHDGNRIADITRGGTGPDELVEVFALSEGGWLLHTRSFPASGGGYTALLGLNSDLSDRGTRILSYGGVTTTSSGNIRWFGRGPLNRSYDHLLLSPSGTVLAANETPLPPNIGSAFLGTGYLLETTGGRYISTDLANVLTYRVETRDTGALSFLAREAGNLRWMEVTIQSTFPYIFYTLDNTAPSPNSTRYTGPFHLQNSAQVRAIAYNADFSRSATNSTNVVVNAIQVRSLRVDPGVMGDVTFEGPVWNGSGETATMALITNANSFPQVLMAGRTANLTALPDPGVEFIRWEGAMNSTNLTVQVVMDTDKQVRAVFGTQVHVPASAHGDIVVDGIPGKRLVPFGPVALQAVPNDGYYFSSWGGTATGSTNPFVLNVTSTYPSATANFLPLGANEAAPTAIVLGPGSVSMAPRKNVYAIGEQVTLRAQPTAGAMFIGWMGATNSASFEVTIAAAASERFTALFAGPTQDGFVTALPASPGATVLTSTNLVDWNPARNVTTTNGANLIIEPAPLARTRYYRSHQGQ